MQNSQCDLESVVDEREHLAPFSLGGWDVSMFAEYLRGTLTRLECQLGLMGVIESSSSGGTAKLAESLLDANDSLLFGYSPF